MQRRFRSCARNSAGPRRLRLPETRFIARLQQPRIAPTVALLIGAHFYSLEVLPECLPYECGAIPFHATGSPIRGLQKILVENNPDYFHTLNCSTIYATPRTPKHRLWSKCTGSLQPAERACTRQESNTSGAKALIRPFFTARLKSCPDTKHEFSAACKNPTYFSSCTARLTCPGVPWKPCPSAGEFTAASSSSRVK